MNLIRKNKGFTLIELLIVIAIIGILAGVILVSTGSARSKSQVAGAKQSLKSTIPYLTECDIRGITINAYSTASAICAGAPNWPVVASCTVAPTYNAGARTVTATCGGVAITCNFTTGSCTP